VFRDFKNPAHRWTYCLGPPNFNAEASAGTKANWARSDHAAPCAATALAVDGEPTEVGRTSAHEKCELNGALAGSVNRLAYNSNAFRDCAHCAA
jgi:hypothetical protein